MGQYLLSYFLPQLENLLSSRLLLCWSLTAFTIAIARTTGFELFKLFLKFFDAFGSHNSQVSHAVKRTGLVSNSSSSNRHLLVIHLHLTIFEWSTTVQHTI